LQVAHQGKTEKGLSAREERHVAHTGRKRGGLWTRKKDIHCVASIGDILVLHGSREKCRKKQEKENKRSTSMKIVISQQPKKKSQNPKKKRRGAAKNALWQADLSS